MSVPEEIRRTRNKLDQARFHLYHLREEIQRPAQVLLAIEAYLGACLGATQAAFFTLTRTRPDFKTVESRWRNDLPLEDRELLNRMMGERDADVHFSETSLHLNMTIQPGAAPGTLAQSNEWRLKPGVELCAVCGRFIDLVAELSRQFETDNDWSA
jgi:hypothetical protein